MMNLNNRTYLRGNAGNDAVVRTTKNGKKVVNFRMATNTTYINPKGEKVVETQWHNVSAWGSIAEKLELVQKGDFLILVGKLMYRNYTADNGENRQSSEIKINFIEYAPSLIEKAA